MKWSYQEVLELSLSVINKTVSYLYTHASVEIMMAGYLGINFGQDNEKKEELEKEKMKEKFSNMNIEKTAKKINFTDKTLLERTKKMFEEQKKKEQEVDNGE